MAEAAEGAYYEVNPWGKVWADFGGCGRSVPVEGGVRDPGRESTSSGFAWFRFRTALRKAAPESTPAPRTAPPAPSVELTEWTAAPEAAVAAASAPVLEGNGEENYARGLGPSPGTSRGRKLKVFAVASLFLVAIALGARAGLAPKSNSGNNQAVREAKDVTLEDCLAMEREGYLDVDADYPSVPGDGDAPVDDPDIFDDPDDAAANEPDVLDDYYYSYYYYIPTASPVEVEGSAELGGEGLPGASRSGKIDGDEPIRRDLRRGREAMQLAEAPSRRRMLDCEELLAANREGPSSAGKSSKTVKSTKATKSSKTTKSTKTNKSTKTTKSTKTKTSKTGKSSTSSDASNGSHASPASTSLSANEGETYVSLAPPASEPTTSDPPTTYSPTTYSPTSELDPDGPCSGRGTLDPSGRQCTCRKGYFPTLIGSRPDCLKVVPVGLGCDGQREPDCREMKFRPEPKCCPRPPRGDLLRCIPTEGPNAGQC